jgi:hypothetical protein
MAAEHTIGEHGRIGDCRIDRRIGSQPGVRHKRMHRQESENIPISGARKGRSLRFSPRSALMCYALILSVPAAYAQDGNSRSPLRVPPQIVFCPSARASLFGDFSCPDQQNQRQTAQQQQTGNPSTPNASSGSKTDQGQQSAPTTKQGPNQTTRQAGQQPKRILGIMPNFRVVSAGEVPPPPTQNKASKSPRKTVSTIRPSSL